MTDLTLYLWIELKKRARSVLAFLMVIQWLASSSLMLAQPNQFFPSESDSMLAQLAQAYGDSFCLPPSVAGDDGEPDIPSSQSARHFCSICVGQVLNLDNSASFIQFVGTISNKIVATHASPQKAGISPSYLIPRAPPIA